MQKKQKNNAIAKAKKANNHLKNTTQNIKPTRTLIHSGALEV